MNSKNFVFLVILLMISSAPISNAQLSNEEKSPQKSVKVTINSSGDVHVKHVIDSSNSPKQIKLISGSVSNLTVKDVDEKEKQYSVIEGNNNVLLIHPSKEDSIIEYDLEDALSQNENIWTWNFRYLEKTTFVLPEEAQLVFVNERPVYLDEKKGIACHGCQMVLEYSINEPRILKNIKLENREYIVEIISHSDIDKFVFDQLTKNITFNVSKENMFITTVIPSELSVEPYLVFLDDEKIFFHQYKDNGTHVWLNVKPDSAGKISIIGTTDTTGTGDTTDTTGTGDTTDTTGNWRYNRYYWNNYCRNSWCIDNSCFYTNKKI